MSGVLEGGGAGLPAQIRRLSFRHGLSEARIQEMVGANAGESIEIERLTRLERSLDIGGAAAWQHRVESALGSEALFDEQLRFLAVSEAGRTVTPVHGEPTTFPKEVFAGARYSELIPSPCSFLNDEYPGLEGLRQRGFFHGRILGVQIHIEMNFGFHFIDCIMELWAVRTLDKGILAHSVLHSTGKTKPDIVSPSVLVRSIKYF